MEDAETKAIETVNKALSDLADDAGRQRVLRWACDRYGVPTPAGNRKIGVAQQTPGLGGADTVEFQDFPDLYHRANPSTDAEKALVGGYWLQVLRGQREFDAFAVNNQLKQMGYPVGNITRAFDALMSQQPRLVNQVRKEGKAKQARKRYQLTHQGIGKVEQMLLGTTQENEQ